MNQVSLYLNLVNLKLVKKVKTKLHLPKAPGPYCIAPIAVFALKKCESELWYILAELFKICLKESCLEGLMCGPCI